MEWYEPEVEQLERTILSRNRWVPSRQSRPPAFYGSSSMRFWTTLAEDCDPRVVNLWVRRLDARSLRLLL